ncbi:MAG: signal peptidase I [Cocleimonas sp.]
MIFIISAGVVLVYYINPYGLKTDNIRPRVFGFDIYQIPSKSMQPLLFPGDFISVSNLAYAEKSPQRKDVVVFHQSKKNQVKSKVQYIKRVIAIAGDNVQLKNGKLFVNKKMVNESYVLPSNSKTSYSLKMKLMTIPQNHVFVMGDNRDNSADSRIFGAISKDEIFAKASGILYGVNNRSGNEIK